MGKRLAGAAAAILAAAALSGPAAALSAECNGDECQGPPPAPEEIIPGTAVVEGPPNPPARFPSHHTKPSKKKPAKKNHQRGAR